MIPTPEQIATMDARGWTYDTDIPSFFVRSEDVRGNVILMMRIHPWRGEGWTAGYGVTGCDYGNYRTHYLDPLTAADEAESWLRGVLAEFRFPWLRVTT